MINKHEKRMKKSEKDERGAAAVFQFSIDNSGEIGSLRIIIPKNV